MRTRSIIPITLSIALSINGAWAADEVDKIFNGNTPFTVDQLPPGQLKRDINRLPPKARDKAIKWLNGFSFPGADLDHLHVDENGGIFYVDDLGHVDGSIEFEESVSVSNITAGEAFSLHSNPGASTVIFVDLDGHTITNSAWNNSANPTYYARAFDTDGDESSFSSSELNQIAEIWHRMAEDFAMFDVDVTTEQPASFGATTAHVLITPNTDANGTPMPASGAGGVAYVNVFGSSQFQFYSPALVYSNNLSNFSPFIAEAASHEAGHNLGLSHDGTSTRSYYTGHGSGATSWGPIMGTGYNDNVSQWSKGEYADANNQQDDIAIMLNKMGGRNDDHADTLNSASLLLVGQDGTVNVTTPQTDLFNNSTSNKGIINSQGDVDVFSFNAGQGIVDLTVTPSWAAWPRNGNRGTNLDIEISLYDALGNLLSQSEPTDETSANMEISVSGGDYYLAIGGVGNVFSPYSAYGSQGHYYISGLIPVGDSEPPDPDTTAPTPDPMIFASAPNGISTSSIAMTASTAVDESGDTVQYYFSSPTATDSGWISNVSYTATGLSADTEYLWQVKARDLAGNETEFSPITSATTQANPVTPEPPAAVSDLQLVDNGNGSATLSWTDVGTETSYQLYRQTWHTKRNRWRSNTLIATVGENTTSYTDSPGAGLYRYYVRSVNSAGQANGSWVSITITSPNGGGGNGGCKGGPKKCGNA